MSNQGRLWVLAVFAIVAFSVVSCPGCATIVSGGSKDISFSSNPPGARVSVGGYSGVTPVTMSVKRGTSGAVRFEKDGYQSSDMTMSIGFNPIFFGNILIGGIIGMVIDIASGAIYEPSPTAFHATLTSKGSSLHDGTAAVNSRTLVPLPPKSIGPGRVVVLCNEAGAEIRVDGRFMGNVPATLSLTPGPHVIELWKEGFGRYSREITVLENSQVSFAGELTKEVR